MPCCDKTMNVHFAVLTVGSLRCCPAQWQFLFDFVRKLFNICWMCYVGTSCCAAVAYANWIKSLWSRVWICLYHLHFCFSQTSFIKRCFITAKFRLKKHKLQGRRRLTSLTYVGVLDLLVQRVLLLGWLWDLICETKYIMIPLWHMYYGNMGCCVFKWGVQN